MATSEIDKLERRYAENPHGLTFAPLAEVHRKNGDIARALELLRIGLELHPNYIPASIVLGRCHQDLGDLPAAEAAFAHVLRLDDENVIALKSLADMNERQNRLDEAERWLRRLVLVDRSNEEARQQLERIQALNTQAQSSAQTDASAPDTRAEAAEAPPEAESREQAAPEVRLPEAPSEVTEMPALELTGELAKEAVPVRDAVEPVGEAAGAPSETLLQQPEAAPPPVDQAPLPGLETTEFQPPKLPPPTLVPLGLEIETESEVVLNSSGASEFSVPDASQDLAALAAKAYAARPRTPGRRASDRVAPEVRQPGAAPAASSEPAAVSPQPEATVKPEPPSKPETPAKSYSARATNGQTIAAFFHVLLAARPPEGSKLAALQRQASSSNGENPSTSRELTEGNEGLVSFDDFFGSAAGGKSRAGDGEPGKDDLDQFHSWLQNLKR